MNVVNQLPVLLNQTICGIAASNATGSPCYQCKPTMPLVQFNIHYVTPTQGDCQYLIKTATH